MEWLPTTSADVESVALPVASSAPLPMEFAPSKKVTVPVGVPPVPVTEAVNVTICWAVDGLGAELTTVLVGVPITCWVKTAETLPEKLVSPE